MIHFFVFWLTNVLQKENLLFQASSKECGSSSKCHKVAVMDSSDNGQPRMLPKGGKSPSRHLPLSPVYLSASQIMERALWNNCFKTLWATSKWKMFNPKHSITRGPLSIVLDFYFHEDLNNLKIEQQFVLS